MEIDAIYSYPDLDVLNEIVSGPQIEVASPFYSVASLKLIAKGGVKRMALITRLPTQYIMPSAFIENDPKSLSDLFSTMNDGLKVYALPSLHAKLEPPRVLRRLPHWREWSHEQVEEVFP